MWVLVAIAFGTAMALAFPVAIGSLGALLSPAFSVTMFAVGLLIEPNDLRASLKAPARPLLGVLVQYSVMPLLAFAVSLFFEDPVLRIGVLLVGCVPGAMASNVMTLLFNGDLVLSVSMTTLATLLCPLVLSLWLPLLADTRVQVDVGQLVWSATWMVVIPVVAGIAVAWFRPLPGWLRRRLPLLAGAAIVLIVVVVVAKNSRELQALAAPVAMSMLALNLGGYALGWLLARSFGWPSPARRALTIEVGMQNAGLGSVLAQAHLQKGGAVPSAFYTVLCVLTVCLALPWAKRKQRPSLEN